MNSFALQPQSVSSKTNFWMIRTKRGFFFDEFLQKKFIAIGWNLITKSMIEPNKLTPTIEAGLKDDIKENYEEKKPGTALQKCVKFCNTLKEGDIAVIVGKDKVALAVIGEYFEEMSSDTSVENEKKINSQYERFWYMLPQFAPRHFPNLCITRVGSTAADCVYIPQSEENPIAVDANFVTLWGGSEETIKICLALLNSTWSKCYLELLCTVMGGGALKIEASHVRQLLFPKLNCRQLQQLSKYGITITKRQKITPELRNAIDATILESFTDEESVLMQIRALLRKKLNERGVKYEL